MGTHCLQEMCLQDRSKKPKTKQQGHCESLVLLHTSQKVLQNEGLGFPIQVAIILLTLFSVLIPFSLSLIVISWMFFICNCYSTQSWSWTAASQNE